MAKLHEQLPAGQSLVSFNHVHHLFRYYHRGAVTPMPWPIWGNEIEPGTYFCFDQYGQVRPNLPFAWKEIGAVPLQRDRLNPPHHMVVVGIRLQVPASEPPPVAGLAASGSPLR